MLDRTRSKSYRDLFKSTAWYYARYRLPYAQAFFDHLVERFQLDGTGRLLDLGTGTGQLAIPLARWFAEVIGMDPEPEMLEEARAAADRAGVANVKWVLGGSDDLKDLQAELGQFRLATLGSSFHWMDRESTLQMLDELIAPSGGIMVTGGAHPTNSEVNQWQVAVKTVIQHWLGEERRAGSSTYSHPKERHAVVIARSPFKQIEIYQLEYEHRTNIEQIIGHLYSTSYCSLFVLGDKREPFEKHLRETLLKLSPTGEFVEELIFEAILARRE